MWEICIFTPLGGPSAVTGQEITLEVMEKKPAMVAALAPKTAEEAILADNGTVPGDALGAAGLDSSIFAHLKRNWTWSVTGAHRKGDKFTKSPFNTSEMAVDRSSNREITINVSKRKIPVAVVKKPNEKRTTKGQKRKRAVSTSSTEADEKRAKTLVRPAVTKRVVKRKQTSVERKPFYDEKDKAALRLMRKLRVDWTGGEDSFLLLCKVAASYLCTNTRNHMVQYTAVRDLLHTHFPESHNKTSRACQRRLNYMLKTQTVADNVALFLEDAKQDKDVVERFIVPSAGEMKAADNKVRLERDFVPLVEMLMRKYRNANSSSSQQSMSLPSTIAEVESQYNLVFPQNTSLAKKNLQGFAEPVCVTDIQGGVVNALITSSLCSASDKKSWAYQLFKIYQQYPDWLLREVMHKLRDSKMVSLKKHYNKAKVKEGNYLPLSSAPYQLSVTFSHTFLCRYQYDIYSQAWALAKSLLQKQTDFSEILIGQEGGFAAATVELMAKGKLQFRTEVPEQLVVLDPNLAAIDEDYVRILQRYKELLRNAGNMEKNDLEVMKRGSSSTFPTASALFTKKSGVESEIDSEMEVDDDEKQPVLIENKTTNEREERAKTSDSNVIFQEGNDPDTRTTTTVAKTASRIALYMMREEMKENPVQSSPIQHCHDFFVISSCAILAKLQQVSVTENENMMVNFHGLHVDKRHLPGNYDAVREILERYCLDANGKSTRGTQVSMERKNLIPMKQEEWSQVEEDCINSGWSKKHIQTLHHFCDYIAGFQVLGATKADVRSYKRLGNEKKPSLEDLLNMAIRHCMVLSVGIVQQRYVHYNHCRDWLLHSFKVVRPTEEFGSVKEAGKLYQGHGPTQKSKTDETDAATISTTTSTTTRSSAKLKSRRVSLEDNTGGEDILCHHRRKNPQVGVKMSREVAEACERINWKAVTEVLVAVRPWVRVDGTLNRRVLDRLLGATLGLVMQSPGQTTHSILSKLCPALQPTHSRELLAILSELGCIVLWKMDIGDPPGLFSAPTTVVLKEASILDEDEQQIVEPAVDAVIRLGMFIGEKVYGTDFACQCPCHPDRRM